MKVANVSARVPAARTRWAFEPGTGLAPGRTVVRLLGGGDRYEAWLGWDDNLAAPVVLKLLRPGRVADAPSRRAIEREADTLRGLAHPAIVRCFDADTKGERPYLVLEFLDGPRLSTLVRRYGALSPEQVVPLAMELASALRYMHNEGLVHLDVKPQNVIMSSSPRLIDLSLARPAASVDRLRSPLGTVAYMAPEQADVERLSRIGSWTDVWGLGATLFEAVNGFRPFRRAPEDEPAPQIAEPIPAFRNGVPAAIRAAIGACLEKAPDARPSMRELYEAFEAMSRDARDVALHRLRRRIV